MPLPDAQPSSSKSSPPSATGDESCTIYTTELMDKLEEMKVQHPNDDTITDDMAAQAYVEQFAVETFRRAETTMDANKVSNQTADTFMASATFLELLQTWAPLSPEYAAKIKFAKYHALRIVKAVKAGQDPNTTNPVKEPDPELGDGEVAPLDPNDPEVQAINGTSSVYEQPSVEDAPDTQRLPGIVRTTTSGMTPADNPPIDKELSGAPSPLQATDNPRQNSVGGGYFPEVSPTSPTAPTPPAVANKDAPVSPIESTPPSIPAISSPPAVIPDVTPDAGEQYYSEAKAGINPVTVPNPQPLQAPVPNPAIQQPPGNYLTDDDAVANAMKHSKWATSALNFEDVPTAVKELREALRSLGAL
ncbi:hypothetical protein FH972_025865 [Carpinus fangiana]|uniref:Vta1 C-terminal domain-containing protein n=1 Tax=Carpinus fangiana TaxID=176857 RepID=A0A5N6L294_9ROSI|nr:hypothetical protein FH972_025865 [Carpinus fangiana]